MDPKHFGAHADRMVGVVVGDNPTTNIDNRSIVVNHNYSEQHLAARISSAHRGLPLSRHDGCWRLLITIQRVKQSEGGNSKDDEAFFVDSEIIEPDASQAYSLQEIVKGYKSPLFCDPMRFKAVDDGMVLENLITIAHHKITQLRPEQFQEIVVIISLEYELISDNKWIKLIKKVKKCGESSPPVAMACLTRPPGTDEVKWTSIGTRSIENSQQIVEMLCSGGKLRDLNWLLIEDETGENADELATLTAPAVPVGGSIARRKTFKQLDHWRPPISRRQSPGARRSSVRPENFFGSHHALWLRWRANTSGFAKFKKRLDKILHSGIPFFFLESLPTEADSVGSACHLLEWQCDNFVQAYCKCHRRPDLSPDDETKRNESLRDACLYWDDHRYKPLKTIQPTPTDLLASPFIP